jgi:hypothetical protein
MFDATPFAARAHDAFATHTRFCSGGKTALKLAIERSQSDVIAFLRSVGAPE